MIDLLKLLAKAIQQYRSIRWYFVFSLGEVMCLVALMTYNVHLVILFMLLSMAGKVSLRRAPEKPKEPHQ